MNTLPGWDMRTLRSLNSLGVTRRGEPCTVTSRVSPLRVIPWVEMSFPPGSRGRSLRSTALTLATTSRGLNGLQM